MNTFFTPLPPQTRIGEYNLLNVKGQGADHIDYNATDQFGQSVILREYISAGFAKRNEQSGQIIPEEGREEAFIEGRNVFLSAANPKGLLGNVEEYGNTYLVYGALQPQVAAAPLRSSAPNFAAARYKANKKSSSGIGVIIVILLLLLAGGGGYVYWQNDQDEKARKDKEAEDQRLAAEAENARVKAEAERLAKEKADAEAKAAEEARLAALEAERKKAEEDRLRKLAEADKNKNKDVPDITPDSDDNDGIVIAKDDDPRLKIYEEPLMLLGVSATSTKNQELWQKAIDTAFETNRYDKYRDFLEKNLKTTSSKMISFGKFDAKAFYDSPLFQKTMKAYNLLSLVDPETIIESKKNDYNTEKFYRALINDEEQATTRLLRSLTGTEAKTETNRIMDTWLAYWQKEEGENLKKYLNLGLACALVDPSTLGGCKTKYKEAIPMEEVYSFFREKAEANLLKTNITTMAPTDLVYVVNVRLPRSEMEWAVDRKNQKGLSRPTWSKAYPMVRYRMDQAKNRRDIYTDYTFEEILDKGGTCMDQGYFASNTAKCNGIPSAYVTGDGKLGPHAWFIYKKDDNSWETAGGYGYTSGTTGSPQTGKPVHESLFMTAGDRRNSGDRLDKTRDYIDIYRTMMKLSLADVALDLLNKAQLSTPEHPLPWEATIEHYSREGNTTTLEQWELLVDTLRRRFKKRPDYLDLAKQIEDEYIFPNKSDQDIKNTLARQRRNLEKNTDEGRADLSAEAVNRQAEVLAAKGSYDELGVLYRKAMRDYGTRTDAFREIIKQYYDYAAKAPDKEKRLPAVVKDIDRNFQKYVNTGSANLFVAKQEVGMQNMIAGYYKSIGEEKKADTMIKQGEKRMERINRTIKDEKDRN